jgi:hypothetical protein
MELWVDLKGDKKSWVKEIEMVDDGTVFGEVPCAKGIDPKVALTNQSQRAGSESGKPNISVYFRSDNVNQNGLQYRWGSVREIQPSRKN